MDETYYTDEMRAFVAEWGNPLNIDVLIGQMEDDEGPFLTLQFDKSEVESRGEDQYTAVAEYLVGLRNGLMDRGARVTFAVTGGQ